MGLLDFLYALNPLAVREAEASTLPPHIAHRFGSRYIEALKSRLAGFPKTATGGEILPKLEAGGVLPAGFTKAYLTDPGVPRDKLIEHLESGWLKPRLYFYGGGAVPEGAVSTLYRIPTTSDLSFWFANPVYRDKPLPELRMTMYKGSGWVTFKTPEEIESVIGPETTRELLSKIAEPLTYAKALTKVASARAPEVPGYDIVTTFDPFAGLVVAPYVRVGAGPNRASFDHALMTADAYSRSKEFAKWRDLGKDLSSYFSRLFSHYKSLVKPVKSEVLVQPARLSGRYKVLGSVEAPYGQGTPPSARYGHMQFIDRSGEPFELVLTPGWSKEGPPRTHYNLGDFLHVRGTKHGDTLAVQEIQSDWVRHMKSPGFPKPPPEAIRKWPEHGVEVTLAYASRMPDVNKVAFLDEPAIAATRGRGEGTYQGYSKALKYAERRAKELGLKTERVPLETLFPGLPRYLQGTDSKPLVVHLTDKAKKAISTGTALLGTSGLTFDWDTGKWQLPLVGERERKVERPDPIWWLLGGEP